MILLVIYGIGNLKIQMAINSAAAIEYFLR